MLEKANFELRTENKNLLKLVNSQQKASENIDKNFKTDQAALQKLILSVKSKEFKKETEVPFSATKDPNAAE